MTAATNDQIVYHVRGLKGSSWSDVQQSADMQSALDAARSLTGKKAFQRVRVDKHFFDNTRGRVVTVPIFEENGRGGAGLTLWLALAVVAGAVTFALTYVAVQYV